MVELPEILKVERAGRALALDFIQAQNKSVEIFTTTCIEGAVLLAAARHLSNHGVDVRITLADINAHSCEPFAKMLEVAGCMDLPLSQSENSTTDSVLNEASALQYLTCEGWDSYEKSIFITNADKSKALSVEEVREIDREAIEDFGLDGICLMENAGIGATVIASEMHKGKVIIVCGYGNNGGDGYVVARGLLEKGADVKVLLLGDALSIKGDAKENLDILLQHEGVVENMPDDFSEINDILSGADLIVDAIFGTGLDREVEGRARLVIDAINNANAQVLSLDIPSGMNGDTGEVLGACVNADTTVTFAAAKHGLFLNKSCGQIFVADIGNPR